MRHHFIGDVHGMTPELRQLMAELAPEAGDVVVFIGDLVDKGPDSVGTVRLVREMAETAPYTVVFVEGNHEDLHRRYRRNLTERPEVAAEQAERQPELAEITAALSDADIAFLEAAVPFHRVERHGVLAVHGGIPADLESFPDTVEEALALTGAAWRAFSKVERMRYVDRDTGAFLMKGQEAPEDPFWAEVYDGRFGHVVFGHVPKLEGPRIHPFATGIDTGAVHGGSLTALVIDETGGRSFVSVPCEAPAPSDS